MQIISAIITMALQSIGQIMTLLLGWIIAAYFGKVPARQKYLFSAMGGVSLIWAAMALSLTSPWIRQLIAVTTSNQMLPIYIRFIIPLAGVGWVLLPLLNGVLAVYYKQATGKRRLTLQAVLRGYKYTPGFAFAMLLMLVSLPLLVLKPVLKGWRREHITIMIESNYFGRVLESIVLQLNQCDLAVELKVRTLLWRSPQALLSLFAHDLFGDWTKSRARLIRGHDFQVVVHPTDLVIEGKVDKVIYVRNTLAKELTFSDAFFTWDGVAHRIETAINLARQQLFQAGADVQNQLASIERQLDRAPVSLQEWEVLYRQIMQLRVLYLTKIEVLPVTYPEVSCKYYHRTGNTWRDN